MRTFVGILIFLGLLLLYKEVAVLTAFLGYIFFGLIRHWRRPRAITRPKSPAPPAPNSL